MPQGNQLALNLSAIPAQRPLEPISTGPTGPIGGFTATLRAQQAKVEKIATTLVEVGVSESLRAMLFREEERPRDLRRELKDVSLPPEVRDAFDLRHAANAFEDIEQLVDRDPPVALRRVGAVHAGRRGREDRVLRGDSNEKCNGRPCRRPCHRWSELRGRAREHSARPSWSTHSARRSWSN